MSNVAFFILFIVGSIVIKFVVDWNKQRSKIALEGGVSKKYSILVDHLQGDEKPKVFQLDNEVYSFGWITPNADNRLTIIESFGSVLVKWDFRANMVFKKVNESKEWRFPEDCNQELAAQKILSEMEEAFKSSL
ncbi:MAG: hypothetical protein ABJB11_08875 [Ferruginibacter sp.]